MGYFDKFKKGKYKGKSTRGKIWYFIWHEDSVESWIINILLAYFLIQYLVYPVLGVFLSTSHPIVAVVSGSMEHRYLGKDDGSCGYSDKLFTGFDQYWTECGSWYQSIGITQAGFKSFPLHNGFNKGDIILLFGKNTEKLNVGDVIVFQGNRPDPIIHRIIAKRYNNGKYSFTTKGDHNAGSYTFETDIKGEQIIGKAFIRVPFLGYVKIWFVDLICLFGDYPFCIQS